MPYWSGFKMTLILNLFGTAFHLFNFLPFTIQIQPQHTVFCTISPRGRELSNFTLFRR